jgi:ATP-binding cassette subfamily B protein
MTQILLALVVMANLLVIFTKAAASANRLNEVFEVKSSIGDGAESFIANKSKDAVEFNNVTFKYSDSVEPALRNISFSIKSGEVLGIIGGTGSGKTTLINLIPRFYDITDGQVKLFGKNINLYKMGELRSHIGIVPQSASLFTGTILENMKWAKSDATEKEVIKALKIAQAWEFVEKLPDGIHTHVSQGGKNLSGGQKQRITIARAFVGSPDIIILDDSMSALDYATDLALRHSIAENMKNAALIIISQRATSLKSADKIIVLDDGEAVGIGEHEELYKSCEVYREIFNTQQGGESES